MSPSERQSPRAAIQEWLSRANVGAETVKSQTPNDPRLGRDSRSCRRPQRNTHPLLPKHDSDSLTERKNRTPRARGRGAGESCVGVEIAYLG